MPTNGANKVPRTTAWDDPVLGCKAAASRSFEEITKALVSALASAPFGLSSDTPLSPGELRFSSFRRSDLFHGYFEKVRIRVDLGISASGDKSVFLSMASSKVARWPPGVSTQPPDDGRFMEMSDDQKVTYFDRLGENACKVIE
jgi:hypothetical protein